MIIIEKNEGAKIPYQIIDNKIAFGNDELTLNLERYERDDESNIDICRDKYGNLVMGVIPGVAESYIAQIFIPRRDYDIVLGEIDEFEQPMETMVPVPFDIGKCTLTLWAEVI